MAQQPVLVIIGAGIGGLAAGVYAQMSGFETHIFEQHTIPGGFCTSWKRKGYLFDGCIHDLAGAGSNSPLNHLWQELCPDRLENIHYHDVITQVEDSHGHHLTVYANIDRFEAHLKSIAPEDAGVIKEYCAAARYFLAHDFYALQEATPADFLQWFPHLPFLFRWGRQSLEQVARKFKNPFLREAFPKIQYNFAGCPALVQMGFLAAQHKKEMGWPAGGSLAFAQSIARRFTRLGGQLHYHSRVRKVLVENDQACGVELEDGQQQRADWVISAGDGHTTIFKLLEGKYTNKFLRHYYTCAPDENSMNLQVSLGINRNLSGLPRAIFYHLEQPVSIAGHEVKDLEIEIYNYDPSIAPQGKSVIRLLSTSPYSYWNALGYGSEAYQQEKQKVADAFIDLLLQRFPDIRQDIEVVDVATPITSERYTASYHGLQAWYPEGQFGRILMKGISPNLPGLKRFSMTGQWSNGMMGINSVAITSRNLIRSLCKKFKMRFETTG
ncbi:hypothetical protein ADN00_06070 [Ornatilinea apprima]|uniref:Amine oxidase domain-containing protein n=1 Tax=Ornatilinea apprima TaxID=1134406 RepID=A0A0P6XGE8_9CHLR|nr:NAD(P)/FAD-dependent oxidoreductase [Ornatilinea apprima]KPL78791.1 hypothetical protein ADN00_06070 [Ornatilinea apprima]